MRGIGSDQFGRTTGVISSNGQVAHHYIEPVFVGNREITTEAGALALRILHRNIDLMRPRRQDLAQHKFTLVINRHLHAHCRDLIACLNVLATDRNRAATCCNIFELQTRFAPARQAFTLHARSIDQRIGTIHQAQWLEQCFIELACAVVDTHQIG